jgi:hypothetical protein
MYPGEKTSIQDGYAIVLNYSEEATKDRKIKFVLNKVQDIEIKADDLLAIIAQEFQDKVAVALTDTDMREILMTEVERRFSFIADKDYKSGDRIEFNVTQSYPVVLAALEVEHNICRQKGGPYTTLDKDRVDRAINKFKNRNLEFLRQMYNGKEDTKGILDKKKEEDKN